ncbi:MAG: TIGR03905 family TSCPD domain-containing protein [Planctomycetes bacterium]|nr:TIGR03905 family TSCPD domain-containing protein [Planctomycetota bacterium]MCD7895772.1 TIGR03905 family TSCPD domain-containing protein [Planctomycetaceae bacterium]
MDKIVILPKGVCCDRIEVELDGDAIKHVEFIGGCHGNGQAIGRLLVGMKPEKAADVLAGVNCEGKGTSCADQFARGIREQVPFPAE